MDRQIALIDDQLDVFDALADLDEITEPAVEATADAEPAVDEAGVPVLFTLPAAPVGEQMTIDLPVERIERHDSASYRPLPTAAPVVFAYVAIVPDGTGANVFVEGAPCFDCDRITIDPARRRAVPCTHARWHARHCVEAWRGGRVEVVALRAGDLDDMVAAARRKVGL